MNPAATLEERIENILLKKKSNLNVEHAAGRPNVLVVTTDPEIRTGLSELFQSFFLDTIWAKGVEAAKSILAKENISACLCGFWLQDGTYREMVRHIRRVRVEMPLIIVSGPVCPSEYRDYLSAVHIGALDFLGHPYRKSELERMLRFAVGTPTQSMSR